MFRREHFPIVLYPYSGKNGEKHYDFSRIEIPPHHPTMAQGIDYHVVPRVLNEAIDWFIADLEGLADKESGIKESLDKIPRSDAGKAVYSPTITLEEGIGINLRNVPIIGHFFAGTRAISPYSMEGEQGIAIFPEQAAESFTVPGDVDFSPELMKEYQMKDTIRSSRIRRVACPNLWYRHNLNNMNAIFYKNLVAVLNNHIVGQK